MTPAQEHKLDELLKDLSTTIAYQKTHFKRLNDLDNAVETMNERVAKNEQNLARASGGLSVAVFFLGLMSAWFGDWFKGGGS